ncbi:MAG: hypothetical protein ACLQU1_07900 [Bryobacteraceae bacterium]
MNHLTEEELILHYYGEDESEGEGGSLDAERHLEACEGCRAFYASLQRVLNVVDTLPVPERGPEYETELWSRIVPHLGPQLARSARRPFRLTWTAPWRWAAAATACAGLMVLAFLAGRAYPPRHPAAPMAAAADPQTGERVLLVAVGDYLERSQMVLIELSNASPQRALDISSEQARAADLVSESRLYRQTAAHTGDTAVASLLDELDRVLLEITHAPSQLSAAEVETLRQRLEAEGILFKVRVLGSKVRHQEEPSASAPPAAHGKL